MRTMRNALLAAAFCVPLLCGGAAWAAPVEIADQARIVRLSDPHVAPDGKLAVFVTSRAVLDEDEYRTEIEAVDLATHAVRALTTDRHHASMPRFSPDGMRLAFVAPDADKKLQVWVLNMDGGEARQVTHHATEISQFAWGPDGAHLAFVAVDEAPKRSGQDRFRDAVIIGNDDFLTVKPRLPSHIWLIGVDGTGERRLTSGTWSLAVAQPPSPPASPLAWAPDGKTILFARQDTASTGDRESGRVAAVDTASGAVRLLTDTKGVQGYPTPAPDGRSVAFIGKRGGENWSQNAVYLMGTGGGAARDVSQALDRNVFVPRWLPDGAGMLVGANDGTTVGLWVVTPAGQAQRVDTGDVLPSGTFWLEADVARDGRIAMVGATARDPAELYLLRQGGRPERVTALNAAFESRDFAPQETMHWQNDGLSLDGVVTYPPHFDAAHKYPLVLYVHGGPAAASRQQFGVMPQVMAQHGWVVFEPNYRGSDNGGSAVYEGIHADAGAGPGRDVMAGIALLQARGFVDPARIAISGWSYGGFMTSWMIGHYNIFRTAVAGAPVTDWLEQFDIGDANVIIPERLGGSYYAPGGAESWASQSPSTAFGNIHAPTLVMCDSGDFRVPLPQAYRLFRALRDRHVETQFVVYPVHGHSPSDPIRQMDVYERWVGWLAAHLR